MEGARPAAAADGERLAELWAQARAELDGERGAEVFLHREGAGPGPDVELGAEGDRRVWVGTYDGVVVGFLAASIEGLADGSRLGRIERIYVEPEARAVGIGEEMIGQSLAWLGREGCTGVDAYALPGMRHTKNFFETFGFTARLLVVHHRLDR